jgi:hypothetical protein
VTEAAHNKRKFTWRGYDGQLRLFGRRNWRTDIVIGGCWYVGIGTSRAKAVSRVRRPLEKMRRAMRRTL